MLTPAAMIHFLLLPEIRRTEAMLQRTKNDTTLPDQMKVWYRRNGVAGPNDWQFGVKGENVFLTPDGYPIHRSLVDGNTYFLRREMVGKETRFYVDLLPKTKDTDL